VPRALLAHHRQDGAGDIHRAEQTRRQLPLDLFGRQFLEVARVKARRVVDQDVDASEPLDGGLHRCLRIRSARHVEFYRQHVL
jgi:hypothetical protein